MVKLASAMQIAITDEEIVKALVAELVQVMSSALLHMSLQERSRNNCLDIMGKRIFLVRFTRRERALTKFPRPHAAGIC